MSQAIDSKKDKITTKKQTKTRLNQDQQEKQIQKHTKAKNSPQILRTTHSSSKTHIKTDYPFFFSCKNKHQQEMKPGL